MSKGQTSPLRDRFLGEVSRRQPTLDAYQKALGTLAINFSLLHFLLESFSWEVFGVSASVGRILTKDLPTKHLVEKLHQCAQHKMLMESDRKDFESILKEIHKATDQRNELLHALWIIQEGKPVFCFKSRARHHKSQAPTVSEINELGRSILGLTVKLIRFQERRPLRGPVELAIDSPEAGANMVPNNHDAI